MRVLMVGEFAELGRALAELSEVEFAVMCHSDQLDEARADPGVITAFPYKTRAKLDPVATRQIRRAVQAFRPDLVHAFYGRALANSVLASIGFSDFPRVVSFAGNITRPSPTDPGDLISFLHPRVAGHACESEAVRRALIDGGVAPESCVTTYRAVAPRTLPRPGRPALRPWGIPPGAFVVGTVATIRRVKGTDLLLEAAIECADLDDIYWLLIGPVRDRKVSSLASDRRIRERVRLLGYRADAPSLISGADLFVMPSRREALCRALLEAMAQRVCPVVSDVGGMKEVVRDGVDGLVIPSENVGALARAIRELHADRELVRRFSDSAMNRVVRDFSPECVAERTIELYHRVLNC